MLPEISSIPAENGKIRFIHGFRDLFETAEKDDASGIRGGATLLISGPPGSGKTTFALAIIRALMAEASLRISSKPDPAQRIDQKVIAYYVSSEVDEETLKRAYFSFGWFESSDSRRNDLLPFRFRIDDPEPDKTNFYVITPMPEVDRPVPSPEELVNGIFNRIAHTLSPSEAPQENARIYVIVDSISALLKGCIDSGEERRQTHEIMHRLRSRFGRGKLALTILLAEQDHRSEVVETDGKPVLQTTPSVEDYLADIVFRLYSRSLPLGRRSRVLEVVKSQAVNMILGEHSWQIITEDNYKRIIRHRGMQSALKHACLDGIDPLEARKQIIKRIIPHGQESPGSEKWGGIIIFPRPQLQRTPKREKDPKNASSDDCLKAGTNGLEDLIIRPGTTTLIAGPVGCGKTTLCRQFLKAGISEPTPVLVSFDIFRADYSESGIVLMDFTQSRFDLNVLAAHIRWILDGDEEYVPKRIAFDGLSEWITMFDAPEAARMLEALMNTVLRSENAPAVFMTYALGLDDDPLGPHALGMNAQNILVVRQIAINDQLRRILYVLKRDDWRKVPEVPLELVVRMKESEAMVEVIPHTLDAYTGLLGRPGDLKPARVLLLLFAENECEGNFNQMLQEKLEQQHLGRLEITYSNFSRSEIGSTLDSVSKDPSPGESASVKVQSVDEWWLGTKRTSEFLHNLRDIWGQWETALWNDYWSFEVEKAKGTSELEIHAVPAYMDFGMFCVNLDVWGREREGVRRPEFSRNDWQRIVSETPRHWVRKRQIGAKKWKWFEIKTNEIGTNQSLLEHALIVTHQTGKNIHKRQAVFTFDMTTRETCVCAFFEFAWAFGAKENLLALSNPTQTIRDKKCTEEALTFLQFMVMEGLMPERGNLDAGEADQTLFARHFYSTLIKHDYENQRRKPRLIALPFMPSGLVSESESMNSAIQDIQTRLSYWIERAKKCMPESNFAKIEAWQRSNHSEKSTSDQLKSAIRCYSKCRALVLDWASRPTEKPRSSSLSDLDDLIELTTWAAFRLQLLMGEESGQFPKGDQTQLSRAMESVRAIHQHLPKLQWSGPEAGKKPVFTGYGCTGSWMYGISKRSRAPSLQAQLLRELTSLERGEERALMGAGMPARKDFFHMHGGEAVFGQPHLNWREFLRYNGSRARRRDRVLAAKEITHTIYTVIHRELLACLRVAALHKQAYSEALLNSDSVELEKAVETTTLRARSAVERIFNVAANRNSDSE